MMPLPRMSRNEHQARSMIANRARACTIALSDTWLLTLEPIALAATVDPVASAWQVRVEWNSARFNIEIPDSACVAWVRRRMPDLDLNALPDELAAAAIEAGLEEAIVALKARDRRGRLRVVGLSRQQFDADPPHALVLTLADPAQSEVIRGLVRADALGLMMIAGLLANRAGAPNGIRTAQLPLPLRAEIGTTALTMRELRALRVHDAVLIEECWLAEHPEGGHALWLATARDSGLQVRLDGAQVTVIESWSKTMTSEAAAIPDADNDDEIPVDMQSIPVRLTFDLGERMMSLMEVMQLQAGQTFDLGRPLTGPVRIRANGALIGTGELIDIDGRMGVSVIALSTNSGAQDNADTHEASES